MSSALTESMSVTDLSESLVDGLIAAGVGFLCPELVGFGGDAVVICNSDRVFN